MVAGQGGIWGKNGPWIAVLPLVFLFSLIPIAYAQRIGAQAPELTSLPYFALRSLLRMFAAFGLSILFALFYGIPAARSGKAERVLIPTLDVLQSIPILGFFPAAIYFFIAISEGSQIGVEFAAIFLIFTSMAWNLAFAVYESVSTIPADLEEASTAFGLRGWVLFRRQLLPACVPKLVYNGMMSWAGGWYFLVAAEIITIGSQSYYLPGLGRFLAESTYAGHFANALIAFGVLVSLILAVDLTIWRPLEAYAVRFRHETVGGIESIHRGRSYASRIAGILTRFPVPGEHFPRVSKSLQPMVFHSIVTLGRVPSRLHLRAVLASSRTVRIAVSAFVISSVFLFVYILEDLVTTQYASFSASVHQLLVDPIVARNVSLIPEAVGLSMLRLAIAYAISLAWTLPVAIKMGRSKRAFSTLMPIFQTLASIPATAYFPFLVVLVIGLPAGVELASILLILTGMQWYLLFNLVAGAKNVPADMDEAAKAFGVRSRIYLRKVMFPSLYPSLVTGSITGWGGGWNALIVSEYIVFGATTYKVLGIGALLDVAAYELGSVALLLLAVVSLSATVIAVNRLFWRRLYRYVTARYKADY